jgi:hypothetical protein
MARTLVVSIVGNATQFGRELDKAAGKTARLGAVAGIAGTAIAAGLAVGLEKSVKAAITAQEETGKLDQAFKNAGVNADALSGKTSDLEAANRKLGFSNNDTRDSLTKHAGRRRSLRPRKVSHCAPLSRGERVPRGRRRCAASRSTSPATPSGSASGARVKARGMTQAGQALS